MDNNDEILNKMIQETLGELPLDNSNSHEERVDFGVLEKYFENRLGQEYAGISTNHNQFNGRTFKHFFRFDSNRGVIDFPRSFGPFAKLAEGQEIQINKGNDTHGLFGVLSLLWPNMASYNFKLSKMNLITLDLSPHKSGSNVA